MTAAAAAPMSPVDDLEHSDADLIRRYHAGDVRALETLLVRYAEELHRFCRSLTAQEHDAQDIAQEAVIRALARAGTLRDGTAFKNWLFSIARNLSIDSHRAGSRTRPLLDSEHHTRLVAYDTPHDWVERREEQQTVAEAMGKLRQAHRDVLILREVHGMSYADIARSLDVSQSAVETLLFRARRRLRTEYDRTALAGPLTSVTRALPAAIA